MNNDFTSKIGLPPGTVVFTGAKRSEKVIITITDFDEEQFITDEDDSIERCIPSENAAITRWIHVKGVHDVEIINDIGNNFGIHPLIIEDISSVKQRPKVEISEKIVYVVLKRFTTSKGANKVRSEQLSFILGNGFLLSFQESDEDIFSSILTQLAQNGSRLRKNKSDYLTYSLIDLIVDNYLLVIESLGTVIEEIEDALITEPTQDLLKDIYQNKRNLSTLRRHIWPLREVVFKLNRDDTNLIQETTQVYMRDIYDHVIRVTDYIETYRESLTSMINIYLSSLSNRMNEVMKVLTVISTIFIPLTLIASLYGTNFEFMPIELAWVFGYPMMLGIMGGIAIVLLIYFRKINWI